eukprot:3449459-Rhodomonas_salina.3
MGVTWATRSTSACNRLACALHSSTVRPSDTSSRAPRLSTDVRGTFDATPAPAVGDSSVNSA